MRRSRERNHKGRGFRRTQRQWENTLAEHLGKFADRITVSHLLDLGALAALSYMYWVWEEDHWGGKHDAVTTATLALPQAMLDFYLLKTGTEVGAALAVGHIAGRGLMEIVEDVLKKAPKKGYMGPP